MIRSPFFYVGDKYKLTSQLKKWFPKRIKNLIEPFVGGGSVFLNTNALGYIENDINPYVIRLHKFLKSYKNKRSLFFNHIKKIIGKYHLSASYFGICVSKELKRQYPKTYYSVFNKKSYQKIKNDFNKNKSNMMLLYVLLVYGFNHMIRFNSKGDFNLPVGNVDFNRNVYIALNNYFDFIEQNKIRFTNYDFETFIRKIRITKDDLIYLDPPYLITSSEYNKYWSEKDEKRLLYLLDWLNKKGYKFALSNVISYKGKRNIILEEWSKKYHIKKMTSNYISFNDNSIKTNIKEILIINYEK